MNEAAFGGADAVVWRGPPPRRRRPPSKVVAKYKAGSPVLQLLALFAITMLAIPIYFFTSNSNAGVQYWGATLYFFVIVLLCWTAPILRGQNIGYPLRAISAIWFIIYGIGPQALMLDDPVNAILVVYAGGLGLAAMSAGYIAGMAFSSTRLKRLPPRFIIDTTSMYWRLGIILGISAAATVIFVAVGGMPIFHPDALNYRFEVRARVSSYVIFMLRAGQLPLYFIWAAFLLGHLKKTWLNKWHMLALIVLMLFVNAVPGWRNPLMFIALNLMFIYMFTKRKVNSLVIGIYASISVFAVLFAGYWRLVTFAGTQRSTTMEWFRTHGSGGAFDIFSQFVSSQFSSYAFGFLTALETFPSKVSYLYGGVFVTTMATFLPGKQELLDEKLKRWSGSNFEGGGLNLSLLGESYADFGWVGIVTYPILYGMLLGYLVIKVEQARTPARIVVVSFMISSICLGSLTGLLSLSQFWVLGVIMIWIAMGERWFTSMRVRPSSGRVGTRGTGQSARPGSSKAGPGSLTVV